jgi:hypothetical protein
MSGHSEKKEQQRKNNSMMQLLFVILGLNGFCLLSFLYAIYFNEYQYDKADITSLVILNILNFICYSLISVFYSSMFFNYIMDILIINLTVLFFYSFTKKAWYFYFLIPGYLCYKVGMAAYNHVKNLDKNVETPEDQTQGKPKSRVTKFNRQN